MSSDQSPSLARQLPPVLLQDRMLARLELAPVLPLGELAYRSPDQRGAAVGPRRGHRELIKELECWLVNSNSNSFHIVNSIRSLGILQRQIKPLLHLVKGFTDDVVQRIARLLGAYAVSSDLFSVRSAATVNEVTKVARAVLRRSTHGESTLIYFRIE